ncbi:MAG TPA: hypothetical protein VM889_07515, partial [Candidatus Thermoplasmatota archaeon]|nr:hypothetical protein [Candidatus Thermoplasmatota archaeon]
PESAVAEFLSERLPAVARRLVVAIVALGAFLLALGALGLAAPDVFQQALLYLVAIVFLGLGVGLMVLALRLRRLVAAVSQVARGK